MYKLYVKYNGDGHYTQIKSGDSMGTMQQVAKYLVNNWQYIEALGGSDKVKIEWVE